LWNSCSLARFEEPPDCTKTVTAASGAAAVVNYGQHFFIGKKLVQVFGKLPPLRNLGPYESRPPPGISYSPIFASSSSLRR